MFNDLGMWVSISALIGAAIAVWQAVSQGKKDREERERQRDEDRDERTRWETKANLKLENIDDDWSSKMESIDINWKPGVNMMLESLNNRMGNLEQQLLANMGTLVEKLEKTNELLGEMNTNLRVYETRLDRLERDVDSHT